MAFNLDSLLSDIPVIGGAFDQTPQQSIGELQKNQQIYEDLKGQLPQFGQYNPVLESSVGDYTPEKAEASLISEDPTTRSSQLSVLNKLAGLSDTGLSDVDQLGYEKARQLAGQISNSGTAAALNNAQARGVGGSGTEFAMREQASQDAAQRAQEASLQQAADSARMKAAYTQAYGQGLDNLRGEDYKTSAANAGILNNFNQYNTTAANQGQQYNLNRNQNIADTNVNLQNQGQQYNNQLKQQNFGDQYQIASGESGANQGVAQGYGAENAARTSDRGANTALLAEGASYMAGKPSGPAPSTGSTGYNFNGNNLGSYWDQPPTLR